MLHFTGVWEFHLCICRRPVGPVGIRRRRLLDKDTSALCRGAPLSAYHSPIGSIPASAALAAAIVLCSYQIDTLGQKQRQRDNHDPDPRPRRCLAFRLGAASTGNEKLSFEPPSEWSPASLSTNPHLLT